MNFAEYRMLDLICQSEGVEVAIHTRGEHAVIYVSVDGVTHCRVKVAKANLVVQINGEETAV